MRRINEYFSKIQQNLNTILETQSGSMQKAAEAMAETLEKDGMIYTFGTGHSHILAEEIFYRAGGLVKVYPIQSEPLMLHRSASASSKMERLHGFAKIFLDDVDVKEGDVLLIFSNSGRNTVSIDMALLARQKGMTVICITNMKHSESVTSRHESGKKLYEVCDIVIDNCGEIGDACVDFNGLKAGPSSTVTGSAVLQAIVCETVDILKSKNIEAEVWQSSNVDGGDKVNSMYIDKYKKEIRML